MQATSVRANHHRSGRSKAREEGQGHWLGRTSRDGHALDANGNALGALIAEAAHAPRLDIGIGLTEDNSISMAYIEIKPHAGTVRVIWRGREVAASDRALDLFEGSGRAVLYVPREDADMSVFEPTQKHTRCPHKGEASYFTLKADDDSDVDAVWSYETPLEAVAAIRGHLAFYPDKVRIES